MRKAYLYIDGASRGNPGPAGIGVILTDEQGTVLARCSKPIGIATNNEAEYHALLRGLEEAIAQGVEHLVCYTDSELLARQLQGHYAVRSSKLKPLFERVRQQAARLAHFEVSHQPREQNREANRLAQKAARRGNLKAGTLARQLRLTSGR
jgi:ribonuclease HI